MIANVTTLVVKAGVPAGTEGPVVGMTEDRNGVFVNVNGQDVMYGLDEVQASHGEVERTKMEYGVEFAGTGLPEELLQIKGQLRTMIDAGWSYLFMEKYLMSMLFNYSMIRKAFTMLTGIQPEDAVNFDYLQTPPCIPAFNLAWGQNKKGGGYSFVMPMATWYGCYNQLDDMTRVESSRHVTLVEALECLGKQVKEVQRWDPPVKENKKLCFDPTQMRNQPQIFMQASTRSIAAEVIQLPFGTPRKEWIDNAYLSARIDKKAHRELLRVFCDDPKEAAEREVVQEAVADVKAPLPKVGGKSPNTKLPKDMALAIPEFIEKKNSELRDFEIQIVDYTYQLLAPGLDRKQQGLVSDRVNATAIATASVVVVSKKDPADKREGWTKFYIVNGILDPSDNINSEEMPGDIDPPGLTDEGLATYFDKTRGLIGIEKSQTQGESSSAESQVPTSVA